MADYSPEDVVKAVLLGNSTSIWGISPPSKLALIRDLNSTEGQMELKFEWHFTRLFLLHVLIYENLTWTLCCRHTGIRCACIRTVMIFRPPEANLPPEVLSADNIVALPPGHPTRLQFAEILLGTSNKPL